MSKLNILWTNDNLITAELMVFMYAGNAKRNNWFDEITLTIWGATAKLSAENKMIQGYIKMMIDLGIKVYACKSCADELGATPILEELGVVVYYMGTALTDMIKAGDGEYLLSI